MTALSVFFKKHGMSPELIDPAVYAKKMLQDMERGLKGEKSSMPMIPTYIKSDGQVELGQSVIVIDAGGKISAAVWRNLRRTAAN